MFPSDKHPIRTRLRNVARWGNLAHRAVDVLSPATGRVPYTFLKEKVALDFQATDAPEFTDL